MRLIPLVLPLLLSAGCGGTSPAPSTPPSPPGPTSSARQPDAALSPAAEATNAFALTVYSKLKDQPGNIAWSPASLAAALTMAWGGARGETAAQMATVLGLSGPADAALAAAGAQIAAWNAENPHRTLSVVNRLYGERTYRFEDAFLQQTQAIFAAPLEPLDYQHDPEGSRGTINTWVAQQTRDRIRDLLPPGSVTSDTRLALVNAIYLLADWEVPFEKGRTRPEPFYAQGTTAVSVPTMHQAEHHRYAQTDGVRVLQMPYQGGDLAMTLVLPDARDGLPALEARLSPATLQSWRAALRPQRVLVSLPSFEINPSAPLSLAPMLAELGMPLAFERLGADFTGIANPPNPDDRLYISAVFHKAFLKVNEQGTEAAAASAVVMARAGSAPSAAPPEFKADHPFLYFLQDTRTGMILFAGRVVDPR